MRKLLAWVAPLRPAACLLGFFISMGSWGIAYREVSLIAFLSSFECFWFLCSTMVINNWIDRFHDAYEKDPPNNFALTNKGGFLIYTITCWIVEAGLIFLMFYINVNLGILSLARALMGFFYSWSRKVPYLPAIMVGIASALGGVTPAAIKGTNHTMWVFLFAGAFVLHGWENAKDVKDWLADRVSGYKATAAAVKGPNVARLIARISVGFGALVFLSMPLSKLPAPTAWVSLCSLSLFSIAAFIVMTKLKLMKVMVGIGMGILVLALNASYWLLMATTPIGRFTVNRIWCYWAFVVLILFALAKPEAVSALVRSGVDNGKEGLGKLKQGTLLWPVMYLLFWLVVFVSRLLWQQLPIGFAMMDPWLTATALAVMLIGLVTLRPPHLSVEGRSYGYTMIERMSAGMVIGFFFTICQLVGLPLMVVAFALPLISILHPRLETLCHLLRSYGCVLGIITGVAIVKGIVFSLANILPAYLAIVAIYYIWRALCKIPVYIPRAGVGRWMGRFFVGEEASA